MISHDGEDVGAIVDDAASLAELRPVLGLILNADRGLRSELDRVLSDFPVATAEYTALIILKRSGELTSAQLARRVYVTPQAMGQIISALEAKGLVVRRSDPSHGRRILIDLNEAGEQLLASCASRVEQIERNFLSGLAPREALYFHQMLQACVDQLSTSHARENAFPLAE